MPLPVTLEQELLGAFRKLLATPTTTQAVAAEAYAIAIQKLGPAKPGFWILVNEAIRARWPRGLERVKRKAWALLA